MSVFTSISIRQSSVVNIVQDDGYIISINVGCHASQSVVYAPILYIPKICAIFINGNFLVSFVYSSEVYIFNVNILVI